MGSLVGELLLRNKRKRLKAEAGLVVVALASCGPNFSAELVRDELEEGAFLFEAANGVVVGPYDVGIGVDELDGAGSGEAVGRRFQDGAGLDGELAFGEGFEGSYLVHVDLLEGAFLVGDEEDFAAEVLEGRRHRRVGVEGVGVEVGVQGDVDLIVADAGVGDGEPGAFAAVAAGADFDETRLQRVGVDLDFHVGGPVADFEGVADEVRVGRENFEDAALAFVDEAHAKVDEVGAVDAPLVVAPDGDDFMDAVTRDGVDDVLVPP
mmetsp:Transcript_15659/g.51255  ORF Transcript_15659/g.51255 Transcript_15659/m.51255 type:complete len:265 (-) Transcript_15659:2354-3148(-)